ncbi:hypothetical protein GCM10011391_37600 [Pullulanibacillus camelliae]|uniref:Core domain-containing protein n=1 Tax=Pullulanibacillus camelliae TaxID=1707096 RepID=A0A8J2YN65_9BACL|nr:iron-sulfur cluster biosynthesis family protein [Pullulanibacillus camelliae]GGE55097.1 hypothetical protein GCM10011391_37600 [Pullulanibacillus camelliae]
MNMNMNMTITGPAKNALNQVTADKMIQLSMDRGSCDIVNTIYEMKVVPLRAAESYEELLTVDNINIMTDGDFAEAYDHELEIDFARGSFIFKNKNQIFNNRVGLRIVE